VVMKQEHCPVRARVCVVCHVITASAGRSTWQPVLCAALWAAAQPRPCAR
jgi:hypothetical protein